MLDATVWLLFLSFCRFCQCLSALRETWNAFLLYPDFFFLQVIEYEVFLPVWLVVCMSNKVINNVSYLEVNLRLFSIVGWWLKVMASMSPGLKWTRTSPLFWSSSNLARKRSSLLMVWKHNARSKRKSSTDVGHGENVDGLLLPTEPSGVFDDYDVNLSTRRVSNLKRVRV